MEKTRPAAIVQVYHPDITPEERAKRMELIRQAAADLVITTRRNRRLANSGTAKR